MSGPFSSPSPFGTKRNSKSSCTSSYESNGGIGLRQRHPSNPSEAQDENLNPNNFYRSHAGKSAAPSSVQQKMTAFQPPRLRLMSCGNAVVSAKYPIRNDSLAKEPKISSENDDYLHEFVPEKQNDPNYLSLWVVVFGFRSQDEFREVYGVMKNIGKIKTKLEGFSAGVGHGGNWAALQYESHIAAEKALARKRITIPDTKILIGIIPMRKVAAELGIDIKNASMPSLDKIAESKALHNSSQMHSLNSEEDVLFIEGKRDYAMDQEDVTISHFDNFCGKVLSWFFMWDSGKI